MRRSREGIVSAMPILEYDFDIHLASMASFADFYLVGEAPFPNCGWTPRCIRPRILGLCTVETPMGRVCQRRFANQGECDYPIVSLEDWRAMKRKSGWNVTEMSS